MFEVSVAVASTYSGRMVTIFLLKNVVQIVLCFIIEAMKQNVYSGGLISSL